MITLKWGNLRSPEFMGSFGKLYGKGGDYFTSSRFALIGKEITKQQKLLQETHEGILKKYGKADEKVKGSYNIPDDQQEAYSKEIEKLEAHEFTVRVAPFDPEKLSAITPLSGQDIHVLDPMLIPADLEKLNGNEAPKLVPQEVAPQAPAPH